MVVNKFALQGQLEADTIFVTDWALSRVLLMDDSRFVWIVLVPRRVGAVEVFDLDTTQRALLTEEIARAARTLKTITGCAKINIGALGNLVPQLHIHIVARNQTDAAWPGPVWGHGPAVRHDRRAVDPLIVRLGEELKRTNSPS